MKTKVCANPDCVHGNEPQSITNFYKNNRSSDGLQSRCKDCFKQYVQDHKEDRRKYRNDNKDRINKRKREIYQEQKEKIQEQNKKSAAKRKDKLKSYKKEYDQKPATVETYLDKLLPYYKLDVDVKVDPDDSNLIQVRCFNSKCRSWFNPSTSQVNNRLYAINNFGYGESNFYCCEECKKTCVVYNFHTPSLTDKSTKHSQNQCSYLNILQDELRELVFELDDQTCQWCGRNKIDEPNLTLHCHHIISPKLEPILSSDINNCVTFCEDCHKYFHSLPGCTMIELAKKIREKILMESRVR